MLGSNFSPSHTPHHHQQQQQQQQQETVAVRPTRPSIADALCGNITSTHSHLASADDADNNDPQASALSASSRHCYSVSASTNATHCSAGTSTHTADIDSESASSSITPSSQSDCPKISDVSSVHGSVSSSTRASLQGQTIIQTLSRQSYFGSMPFGLNQSLPQLNNIDNVLRFASQNELNRTVDGFRDQKLNIGESCSPPDTDRTPQPCTTNVDCSETNAAFGSCLSLTASREQSRLEEEERRLSEFLKIEDVLRTTLPDMDKELDTISSTCTSESSSSDLVALDRLDQQFMQVEQHLDQLTAASGDILEVAFSVEMVKPIQDKVSEVTERVASTRRRLGEVRSKVRETFDTQHSNKVEMSQLVDWLTDAIRRLGDCTDRPTVNAVVAEQRLGQLLTLIHEFGARKARFKDLENRAGLDADSVAELRHQFERASAACHDGLERHRRQFSELNDIRNGIHQVASWVVKTGPMYSLDGGSAGGSLDLMDETLDELERRLEEVSQLRSKADDYLAGLRTSEGQSELGQGQTGVDIQLENESSLMQPLLECHCQLYQLRELIAERAASMVSVCVCVVLSPGQVRLPVGARLRSDTWQVVYALLPPLSSSVI